MTRVQLADEMRARVLSNVEAWIALRRPFLREFERAEYNDRDDDRRMPIWQRDPRAVELEYAELRVEFWDRDLSPGEVRLIARRAVLLARDLARRAIDQPE